MSLDPRRIALQGVGYAALFLALQGLQPADAAVVPDAAGGGGASQEASKPRPVRRAPVIARQDLPELAPALAEFGERKTEFGEARPAEPTRPAVAARKADTGQPAQPAKATPAAVDVQTTTLAVNALAALPDTAASAADEAAAAADAQRQRNRNRAAILTAILLARQ